MLTLAKKSDCPKGTRWGVVKRRFRGMQTKIQNQKHNNASNPFTPTNIFAIPEIQNFEGDDLQKIGLGKSHFGIFASTMEKINEQLLDGQAGLGENMDEVFDFSEVLLHVDDEKSEVEQQQPQQRQTQRMLTLATKSDCPKGTRWGVVKSRFRRMQTKIQNQEKTPTTKHPQIFINSVKENDHHHFEKDTISKSTACDSRSSSKTSTSSFCNEDTDEVEEFSTGTAKTVAYEIVDRWLVLVEAAMVVEAVVYSNGEDLLICSDILFLVGH